MAKVEFTRVQTNAEVENIDIKDGQFIVTGEGKTFVDYGEDRIGIGGTPDIQMSDSSTNSVENRVIKGYVDNVADSIPELSNTYGTSNVDGYTQNYINNNVGVVDSGSNTNGSYVKYADGTMICSNRVSFTRDITSEYEGMYFNSTGTITFPQEFISAPFLTITLEQNGSLLGVNSISRTTTGFGSYVWKSQAKSNVTFYLHYIAIGRWK
jgi:hypothetical protein